MIDFKKIETLCRATVPGACMAFLGGSQVANNGQNKVTGSDYDIVVLTTHTPYPVSYNHMPLPGSDETVDLIVRDAETLAFELVDSKRRARAAIPNIIAEGKNLFDDKGSSSVLKAGIENFLTEGPDELNEAEYTQRRETLAGQAKILADAPPDIRWLATYELTHHIGALYLHHARKWHASGKLLGRFLLQEDAFKKKLESMHDHMKATGDSIWAISLLPPATQTSRSEVQETGAFPLKAYVSFEKDQSIKDVFDISYDAQSLREFYKENPGNIVAKDFMATKAFTLVQALNPERIGRPSNEYFYALCRVVYNLSEFAEVKNSKILDGKITSRYDLLLRECPTICKDVNAALAGKPENLKKTVEAFSASLSDHYTGQVTQVGPSTFRLKNEILSSYLE